jgi:hypothetical protein
MDDRELRWQLVNDQWQLLDDRELWWQLMDDRKLRGKLVNDRWQLMDDWELRGKLVNDRWQLMDDWELRGKLVNDRWQLMDDWELRGKLVNDLGDWRREDNLRWAHWRAQIDLKGLLCRQAGKSSVDHRSETASQCGLISIRKCRSIHCGFRIVDKLS